MKVQEINWLEEVHNRKEELIKDTQAFLQIKSVYEEETKGENAPMGQPIAKAMQYLLNKASKDGFQTKNLQGYAGHIEWGAGQELIGVLCHIDVVPEGEGWTSPPYAAEIRDGKIYARGAIDDKGPTMAAYYALKIVKELELPIQKRIRIIIGTDEESNWQCVDHYFKHEEMPTMGFAPDADFPIIYAEKGIANFFLVKDENQEETASDPVQDKTEIGYRLVQFDSGLRVNMVPERAKAKLEVEEPDVENLIAEFTQFLAHNQLNGSYDRVSQPHRKGYLVELTMEGISAHGAEPQKGKNAGFLLLHFLQKLSLQPSAHSFIQMVNTCFVDDIYGQKLGIALKDEMTGPLTINVGVIQFAEGKQSKLGISLRYPVTTNYQEMISVVEHKCQAYGYEIREMDHSAPHHVDESHPLIQTLQRVYEAQTKEKAELLSIGGGTYARSLKAGVAFGPLFPGKEETAHQKDEYIEIEDLLKATAIYAQAIYELAAQD